MFFQPSLFLMGLFSFQDVGRTVPPVLKSSQTLPARGLPQHGRAESALPSPLPALNFTQAPVPALLHTEPFISSGLRAPPCPVLLRVCPRDGHGVWHSIKELPTTVIQKRNCQCAEPRSQRFSVPSPCLTSKPLLPRRQTCTSFVFPIPVGEVPLH